LHYVGRGGLVSFALAAIPNASYLEAHGFGLETYLKHPMQIHDGITIAPERIGYGAELDWAKLARQRVA
jgi:L-alanine-DL-glutamate epimerase-like enolase superfamily enzyme